MRTLTAEMLYMRLQTNDSEDEMGTEEAETLLLETDWFVPLASLFSARGLMRGGIGRRWTMLRLRR